MVDSCSFLLRSLLFGEVLSNLACFNSYLSVSSYSGYFNQNLLAFVSTTFAQMVGAIESKVS